MKGRMMMGPFRRFAILVAALLAAAGIGAAPASATESSVVWVHSCAYVSCTHVADWDTGHSVVPRCWVYGEVYRDNPYWDLIFDPVTGYGGWVSEADINSGSASAR